MCIAHIDLKSLCFICEALEGLHSFHLNAKSSCLKQVCRFETVITSIEESYSNV